MQMTTNVISKINCPPGEMQGLEESSRGRMSIAQKPTHHIIFSRLSILRNKAHVSSCEVSHILAEHALNSYANHSAAVIMAEFMSSFVSGTTWGNNRVCHFSGRVFDCHQIQLNAACLMRLPEADISFVSLKGKCLLGFYVKNVHKETHITIEPFVPSAFLLNIWITAPDG